MMSRSDVQVWDSTGVAHLCYCPSSFAGFGHFSECIWPFYDLDSFGTLAGFRLFCRRRRARLQEIRALSQITQGSLALHFE